MRITEKFIVGSGIAGDIIINGADIYKGKHDIFTYGSMAFDGAKGLILIKGAEVFNPVVDVKALGYDTDFDGDGFAEYTEWISDTQGLLVWDRNQNGVIDDGKELFGDYSILNSGKSSKDGFEALADFDTNGDGCVDASDDGWSKLRVWMDNGDGFSQKNELKTLDELGIKRLNVSVNNIVDHQSDYINADGTKGKMKDYFIYCSVINVM